MSFNIPTFQCYFLSHFHVLEKLTLVPVLHSKMSAAVQTVKMYTLNSGHLYYIIQRPRDSLIWINSLLGLLQNKPKNLKNQTNILFQETYSIQEKVFPQHMKEAARCRLWEKIRQYLYLICRKNLLGEERASTLLGL